ncbi:ATP-binding protein [Roseibium sp. HPY-6]|uniref:AAA family ATPase n=1 Tax=Roseibium sp. HPY-6 TaxID=3229852 RepID=UPI00338EA0E4
MSKEATLYLVCGKVASGKSTLARSLAAGPGTVLLSEDVWLKGLYADRLETLSDYVKYSERLKVTLEPHIVCLLRAGLSVVLDFAANTVEMRKWMRRLFEAAGCPHELHLIDVPDEVCKQRLRARNAAGTHEFRVSDEQFDRITSHFQPPTDTEGFNVHRHRAEQRDPTYG